MKQHVTIKEIARILDCSTKTVSRKVNKGLIPAIQPGGQGSHIRFDVDDVIRAVKEASLAKDPPATNTKSEAGEDCNDSKRRPGPTPQWKQKLKQKQIQRGNNE